MEIKNHSQKIILLLFPLIINKFDFQSGEKLAFFDLGKVSGKEKNIALLEKEELLKLTEIDYSQKVREFIQQNPNSKLLLVNYPHNKQQFNSLSAELTKEGKKISNIILLNVS